MSPHDRNVVEQLIQTYFDGLYEGDADKLASIFHETSALTFEQDGQLTVLPLGGGAEGVCDGDEALGSHLSGNPCAACL
jgi:hypothetical protein